MPRTAAMHIPRDDDTRALQRSGMADIPPPAPQTAPAIAAIVSVSLPTFTAPGTASVNFPLAAATIPNASPTASGARSDQK